MLPVPFNPYFIGAAMLEYTIEEGRQHLKIVVQKDGAFQYEECYSYPPPQGIKGGGVQ